MPITITKHTCTAVGSKAFPEAASGTLDGVRIVGNNGWCAFALTDSLADSVDVP